MTSYIEKLEKLRIPNPTLCDCFDPSSHEFSETTMQHKIETLQKIISNNLSLLQVTEDYCKFYEALLKPYVAKDLHEGLKILINYILEKHTCFKIKSSDIYSNEELIIILTSLLKDTNKFSLQAKQIFYNRLVFERKKYQYRNPVILNPSKLDISNDEHLNAWAYWHSDLNADILLIGQDFGGYAYYSNYDGKDDPENKTNINLTCLFSQLEIDLGQSDAPNINAKLYFTNAVLGVKNGAMSAPIKKGWYSDTAIKFIKPLIGIIQPKIIIALGSKAYDVISIIYSLDKKPMKEIIDANPISLPDNKKLFVVYHCSNLGIANRSFNTQREDWKKIKAYMDQNGW